MAIRTRVGLLFQRSGVRRVRSAGREERLAARMPQSEQVAPRVRRASTTAHSLKGYPVAGREPEARLRSEPIPTPGAAPPRGIRVIIAGGVGQTTRGTHGEWFRRWLGECRSVRWVEQASQPPAERDKQPADHKQGQGVEDCLVQIRPRRIHTANTGLSNRVATQAQKDQDGPHHKVDP